MPEPVSFAAVPYRVDAGHEVRKAPGCKFACRERHSR